MKLLIVEDEEATLMGLSTILDWNEFGIQQVFLASNGEKGLIEAQKYHPEIVLTDIRMPRMDGICMAEKIRAFLPDTQIIFLSAYQEIDYYKAAISLKAVNYIEKPVMASDMKKVLAEAVQNLQKNDLLQKAVGENQAKIRENVAQKLLLPNVTFTKEQIDYLVRKGIFQTLSSGYITSVLIWTHKENAEDADLLIRLTEKLSSLSAGAHVEILGTRHSHNCIAVHFLTEQPDVVSRNISTFLRGIHMVLEDCETYYVTVGKTVHGALAAFESWQTAAILLQEIFYEPFGSAKLYHKDSKVLFSHTLYQTEKEKLLHSIGEKKAGRNFYSGKGTLETVKTGS